jgi:transcriptional regulator with XRE-family HTH domain
MCREKSYHGDWFVEVEILVWQIRDKRGMSLRKLERMTGISKSTLHNIENKRKSPTLDELELIAKALKCAMTDLYESDMEK